MGGGSLLFFAGILLCSALGKKTKTTTTTLTTTITTTPLPAITDTASLLYVCGQSYLFLFDAANKILSLVGDMGPGINCYDIAICPDGTLFMINQNQTLYIVNKTTATLSNVAVLNGPISFTVALTCGSDGTLYASNTGTLVTVDKVTAATSVVGTDAAITPIGDIVLSGNNTMYLSTLFSLVKITLNPWSVTVVGPGGSYSRGLAIVMINGTSHMYGCYLNQLFEIDPITVQLSNVFNSTYSGYFSGTASLCWAEIGLPTLSTNMLSVDTIASNSRSSIFVANTIWSRSDVIGARTFSSGSTPTVASLGSGIVSGTITGGTDCSFEVKLTTGPSIVSGDLVTIAFSSPFPYIPFGVIASPSSPNGGQVYVSATTAQNIKLSTLASTVLTANTIFKWSVKSC